MQRLLALFLLAAALLKTILSWPLRRRRAPAQFRTHYAPDGLLPKSAELHRALLGAGGCTGCRRCDRVAPSGAASGAGPSSQPSSPQPALSYLAQAWLRSLPDADLAHAGFAGYTQEDLARADELCPYGVSLTGLARLAELSARPAVPGGAKSTEGEHVSDSA